LQGTGIMSKRRIIINSVLVVVLLATCWLAYATFTRRRPQHYWEAAKAAADREDYEGAKLHLQTLLQLDPDHADGQYMMAEYLLAESRYEGGPDTYAAHPQAFAHLKKASELRPDQLLLQQKVLRAYLASGRLKEAVEAAEKLLELQANDPDARYALALKAAANKERSRAERHLEKLVAVANRRRFQALALEAQLARTDPETLGDVLNRAVAAAKELDDSERTSLGRSERNSLEQLFATALAKAENLDVAHARMAVALDLAEPSARREGGPVGGAAAWTQRLATILAKSHPISREQTAQRDARRQLIERAEKLWVQAVEAKQANLAVYYSLAVSKASAEDYEAALQLVEGGLESAVEPAGDDPDSTSGDDSHEATGDEEAEGSDTEPADAQPSKAERNRELLRLHRLAGQLLLRTGQYDKVQPHAEALLQNESSAGWGHLLSGGVATAQGRYERALEHLSHARQRLGESVHVHLALSNALVQLRRWGEALPHLQAVETLLGHLTPEQLAENPLAGNVSEQMHFGLVRAHLQLGSWNEAVPHLGALNGSRLEPLALTLATSFRWAQDQRSEALRLLEKSRQKYPGNLQLLILQARYWHALERSEQADRLIEQFASQHPDSVPAQALLVRTRVRQKREEEAARLVDKLVERFPTSSVVRLLKARLLLAEGKAEEVLAMAESLTETEATALVGSVLGAAAELNQQNLAGARDHFNTALEHTPRRGALSLLQSTLSAAEGNLDRAVASLNESLDVTAVQPQARTLLLQSILLLAVKEGPAEAEKHLAPLLRRHPQDPFLAVVKADLCFKQGKIDEGMEHLDRYERLESGSPLPFYLKAGIFTQLGDGDRAAAAIGRALDIDPEHGPSRILAARISLGRKKYAEALAHADKALAKNNRLADMQLVRAEALLNLERLGDAARTLSELIQARPKWLAAYRGLEVVYLNAGNVEEALSVCRKGREQLPEEFVLASDEVELLCRLGKTDDAQQVAQSAVGDEPESRRCLALAQNFVQFEQPDLAKHWADRALELAEPEEAPNVHRFLGDLTYQEGLARDDAALLREAENHYRQVLEQQPQNLTAGNNLAYLLSTRFDQPEEAISIAERVRGEQKLEQLPVYFFETLVSVYTRAGKTQQAAELLREALLLQPGAAKWHHRLGMIQLDTKQPKAARQSFATALRLGLPDEQAAVAKSRLEELSKQLSKQLGEQSAAETASEAAGDTQSSESSTAPTN